MTNSEWIRNMTDEELASFIQPDMHVACYICDRCAALLGDLECQDCRTKDRVSILLNWLSKEHVSGEVIIEGVIQNGS